MNSGKVYLIGAGPGDPDLVTIKGLKILQQADVVIYDYLVDKKILEYTKPNAKLICGDDLVKEKHIDGFAKRQDKINKIIIKEAKQGKRIVRLKNGDPMIFARANEELSALTKNKINFAIVPGVTAATAGACFSGIPLTVRGVSSSVVITTGHESIEKNDGFIDWDKIAQIDTIVLYMAVENLPEITRKLINSGKKENTSVAVISNVSKICQKEAIGNLKNIVEKVKKEKITAPAIVIIGDVVEKEKKFNWFKKTKKVLYTGISEKRFFENGLFFHMPMIEIKPLEDYTELDNWIKRISNNYQPTIDWIVFTSRFGVYYFFDRLFKLNYDTRKLNKLRISAIGSSTASKLKEYGIIPDLVPKNECSDGLVDEFKKLLKKKDNNKNLLLIRSDIADKNLTKRLTELGYNVYSCIAYRNVKPSNLPDLDLNFFDEIFFTSPSTVRNFVERYGKPPKKVKIRTIGAITKKEVKKWILKNKFYKRIPTR